MQTTIDNYLINYKVFGDKNKKDILILHGWGQSAKDWEKVAIRLGQKYRIFVPDLLGFGSFKKGEINYSFEDYLSFVSSLIKKFKLKNYILIGHSFGGKLAIAHTSKNNSAVSKLILISPSGIEERGVFTRLKIILIKIFKFLPWTNAFKGVAYLYSYDYKTAGKLLPTFKRVAPIKVDKEAKKISSDTLIIWPERDEQVNLKWSKKLKRLIPGSELRVLWKANHSPHITDPDRLLRIINEYL